ncbi:MAG: dTDP-4-keto-6-deoxy-D-glucose epimerase [Fuerstiella sp.]|nr:dTDP-4-keto-6-deoxy-D-glucose epimerase [Fuerstiella sp.]MCP4858865.1 dTDP-4-keto-6-deoxy-D-glucose epimerase [Fuerstiella sp.]
MQFQPLAIPDVVRIDLDQITDGRGFFARLFCREELEEGGIEFSISQCNNTLTRRRGSIRGFHFQRPPKAEAKIVRCIKGAILDVAVDLRAGSETFGNYCSCELTESNRSMMSIPQGFAHGFQTLTDDVELIYFHSESYSPDHEGGLNPLDVSVAVEWPLPVSDMSERDLRLPELVQLEPIKQ